MELVCKEARLVNVHRDVLLFYRWNCWTCVMSFCKASGNGEIKKDRYNNNNNNS